MGLTSFQRQLACTVLIFVLFLGWCLFPLFFKVIMNGVGIDSPQLSEYGPLGDIYGSLNALLTSITLGMISYTAFLQHKVSKVVKQESFRNMFYGLLQHNREIINSIKFNKCLNLKLIRLNNEVWGSVRIFGELSNAFSQFLKENDHRIESLTRAEVRKELRKFVSDSTNNNLSNGFYSSFKNYKSLVDYVKKESFLTKVEKEYYFSVIRNSMYYGEKKALLWLMVSSNDDEYMECFKGTYLLDLKIRALESDDGVARNKKNRLIRFINHFEVESSVFKSYEIIDDSRK